MQLIIVAVKYYTNPDLMAISTFDWLRPLYATNQSPLDISMTDSQALIQTP